MKMMKLMGAASAAALIAGAANAQLQLELSDVAPTAAGTINATSGTVTVAEEVDFAALSAAVGGSTGTVGLEVLTQGQIPPGQNIFLTVQLTNAVFASALDGDEVVSGDTGSVVNSGGAAGESTVRYLVTSDTADTSSNGGARDAIGLVLPILMSSCGDVTAQVTEFQTESAGTPIEGGTASLTTGSGLTLAPDEIADCDDAFWATISPDTNPTAIDFMATAGAFEGFVADTVSTDTATVATIGDAAVRVDTSVFIDFGSTAASVTDVIGYEADIDFVDDAGIASGAGTGAAFWVDTAAAASNTIALDGDAVAGAPATAAPGDLGNIEITADATNDMMAQVVSVSDAILNLRTTGGSFLSASDPFLSADVEDLVFNGSTFGPFDWVADSNGRVNSIFRVTGLAGLQSDVPSLLITENSRNGVNGVFPFTLEASSVQGSEVRLNSTDIEGIVGSAFGTADITWIFGATLDLDVDRLLSGPSTATVVPFGDNANSDETNGDTDQLRRSVNGDDDGNF